MSGKLTALTLSGGRSFWESLKGKTITNNIVILNRYGDIHPYSDGPKFLANKLYVRACDKNFVYYWINRYTFPNVKDLYLLSHPCEPTVLHRAFERIYLSEGDYNHYKERWASEKDNITSVKMDDIIKEIETYECENMCVRVPLEDVI
jgi:hypothetical protein